MNNRLSLRWSAGGCRRGVDLGVRWCCVAVLLLAGLFGAAGAQTKAPNALLGAATSATPVCPAPRPGLDYSGMTLRFCNFARASLASANFSGASLMGVVFDGANLNGATFDGATIEDSGPYAPPTDFSFAMLANAKLTNLKVQGRVYFTYADLSCASFGAIDLTTTKVVLGAPLKIGSTNVGCPTSKRTSFAGATLNCDFISQWKLLDLSKAKGLSACQGRLQGVDLSGALLDDVAFDGLDLTASRWDGASARKATFNGATLDRATGMGRTSAGVTRLAGAIFQGAYARYVDFSGGELNGAIFNKADLTGSNFSGATFIADVSKNVDSAATFLGAHLKFANFSNATLNSVKFAAAAIYGSTDSAGNCKTWPAACLSDSNACTCASMRDANLTLTDFTGAYLYGVDFGSAGGNTILNATNFGEAVLVASNFVGASFIINTQGGSPVTFSKAWLQGANLEGTDLSSVSLDGALLDFGAYTGQQTLAINGKLQLELSSDFAGFAGWGSPGSTICAAPEWSSTATKLPTGVPSMTCPDGRLYADGCGAMIPRNMPDGTPVNTRWKASAAVNSYNGTYVKSAKYVRSNPRIDKPMTYEDAVSGDQACTTNGSW